MGLTFVGAEVQDFIMDTKNADFGRTWKYTLRDSSGKVIDSKEFGDDQDALHYFQKFIDENNLTDSQFQIERSDGFKTSFN